MTQKEYITAILVLLYIKKLWNQNSVINYNYSYNVTTEDVALMK